MVSTRIVTLNATFGLLGSIFLLLGVYCLYLELRETESNLVYVIFWKSLTGVLLVISTFLSGVCFHILSLPKSGTHTVPSVTLQYLLYSVNRFVALSLKRKLKASWRQPRNAQEALLKDLLHRHETTEYGTQYGFTAIRNLEDFRNKHPLTRYPHYEEYIARMTRGEENILMVKKPTRFALTSGTTGKAKILPVSSDIETNIYLLMAVLKDNITNDTFPGYSPLQKVIRLYWEPTVRTTECNIPLEPLSKLNPKYKHLVSVSSSSPTPAFSIKDVEVCTYVHTLFALRERSLGLFMTSFTTSLYSQMKHMEDHWQEMLEDLRRGTINASLSLPQDIRKELEQNMWSDPVRADELQREFERGFVGIIGRLWPDCVAVVGSDAAGIKSSLQQTYCKGIPLYGSNYTATEGVLGVNLWPLLKGSKDRFVLLPSMNVMEFICEDNMDQDQPETLFIDELQIGQSYEMVLTVSTGLCRFRFGDVIKVVEYHGNCPVVEFRYRSGQMLNVCGEKVDQAVVSSVMKDTLKSLGNRVMVDYACAESNLLLKGGRDPESKPYYMFFIELEEDSTTDATKITRSKLNMVDELLCSQSFTYNSYREKNMITPAHVHLMKAGSFKTLQEYIISNSSASMNQFKNHRKLQTWETLDMMLQNVLV